MIDFNLIIYRQLISAFRACGYPCQTFADFIRQSGAKTIILRHDVDKLPTNALKMALLETT